MPLFKYKALDTKGETVEGQTDAPEKDAALRRLTQTGLAVFDLELAVEAPVPFSGKFAFGRAKSIGDSDLAQMCLGIGQLLSRNYTVEQALEIAEHTTDHKLIRKILMFAKDALTKGASVHDAFEVQDPPLPREMLALLRAGERSNALELAFTNAGQFLKNKSSAKNSLMSALAYPAFLLVCTIAIFVFIQIQLVPTLYATSLGSASPVPSILQTLVNLNIWLSRFAMFLVPGFTVLLVLTILSRRWLLSSLLRLFPPLARLVHEIEYARSARIMSAFLTSGDNLVEAVKEAQIASNSPSVTKLMTRVEQSLALGEPASNVFMSDSNVPRSFVNFFSLGEKSNDLVSNLDFTAELLETSYQRRTERLVALASPIMTLIVGVLVGVIVFVLITTVLGVTEIAL